MSSRLIVLLVSIVIIVLRVKCQPLEHSIDHLSLLLLGPAEELGVLRHVQSGKRPLVKPHILLSVVNSHILLLLLLLMVLLVVDMHPLI